MHLIEGWGTGIPRLLQDMKDYGLAEPEFIDMEVALRINLYRANTGRETIEKIKTSEEMCKESSEEIKTGGETSKENGKTDGETKIRKKTTAERVGLSYAGIRYVMKKLQERGLLKRIGSTKKGQWIIKQ